MSFEEGQDQDERSVPSGPEPSKEHPETAVGIAELGLRLVRVEDRHLLAESDVLEDEVGAWAKYASERTYERAEKPEHVRSALTTEGWERA